MSSVTSWSTCWCSRHATGSTERKKGAARVSYAPSAATARSRSELGRGCEPKISTSRFFTWNVSDESGSQSTS